MPADESAASDDQHAPLRTPAFGFVISVNILDMHD
jgi:hypothetical protein